MKRDEETRLQLDHVWVFGSQLVKKLSLERFHSYLFNYSLFIEKE